MEKQGIYVKGKMQRIEQNASGKIIMTLKLTDKSYKNMIKKVDKYWLKTYDDLIYFHYEFIFDRSREIDLDITDYGYKVQKKFVCPRKDAFVQVGYDRDNIKFYIVDI